MRQKRQPHLQRLEPASEIDAPLRKGKSACNDASRLFGEVARTGGECLPVQLRMSHQDASAFERQVSPFVQIERDRIGVFQSAHEDRKSTRLNSSHVEISYAVFCLK